MTTILIDLNTLEPHPQAGATVSKIPTRTIAHFNHSSSPLPCFEDEDFMDNCLSFETEGDSNGKFVVTGSIDNPEWVWKMINKKLGIDDVRIEHELSIIHHDPNPSHTYEYEQTKIVCNECGHGNDSEDLEYVDDDEVGKSHEICSVCRSPLYLEYETLEQALERQRNQNPNHANT